MEKKLYNVTFEQGAVLITSYHGIEAENEEAAIAEARKGAIHPDEEAIRIVDEGEVRVILKKWADRIEIAREEDKWADVEGWG